MSRSNFNQLAHFLLRDGPFTTRLRVWWQDNIALQNRRGEITNEEALRLLTMLDRLTKRQTRRRKKKLKLYGKKRRKTSLARR